MGILLLPSQAGGVGLDNHVVGACVCSSTFNNLDLVTVPTHVYTETDRMQGQGWANHHFKALICFLLLELQHLAVGFEGHCNDIFAAELQFPHLLCVLGQVVRPSEAGPVQQVAPVVCGLSVEAPEPHSFHLLLLADAHGDVVAHVLNL